MKKILVCNQKGGVGKSLIADELAFSFERSGIPTVFLGLDSQGGTIHKTNKNADAEVCVIVVPTRTTSRDIEPLWRMKKAIEAAGKTGSTIYVMNGWNRYKASSDFFEWFNVASGDDSEAPIYKIPQSEYYVQASAAKKSVVGFSNRGSAASAMRELCDAVRAAAGFSPEDRADIA